MKNQPTPSLSSLNHELCVFQPPAKAYRVLPDWRPLTLAPGPEALARVKRPSVRAEPDLFARAGRPRSRRRLVLGVSLAAVLMVFLGIVNLAVWGIVRVNHQRSTHQLAQQLRRSEVANRNLALANRSLNAYVVVNEARANRRADVLPASYSRPRLASNSRL